MEKEVVENLWNGDRDSQIQAAMKLSRLRSKQRHKLAESGAMVPLISMLHSKNYEAIEASLCALLSLCFGSERNKIRIIKCGALPVLLNFLHCRSQPNTVTQMTLVAMLTLSSCNANKVAIASSGAIQLLAEFVNSSCSTQSQLDAIATLHNLTTCQNIVPLIVSSGVILSLLELIHRSVKSSQLVEKAIGLLENIVSSLKNALCEACSDGRTIRMLVETIEDGSLLSKEHAVSMLLLICQSCRDKYRGLILTEGVMPGLLQLSVDGTRRAKSMARELLLLLRDCRNYSSRRKHINHELIERVMEEIDSKGEKLGDTTLRLIEEMLAKLNA
ncbi:U-box domain-containing protein 12-like [Abrus precatorius]|uniref:U-box domain-containing protein 12-like n=1 Tax=Abrus precatorius TaxID=3816 RepID=A0A8B8LR54_ABRPR|nr:U-box domain-containing protein 12-like [Abrus precatorius]